MRPPRPLAVACLGLMLCACERQPPLAPPAAADAGGPDDGGAPAAAEGRVEEGELQGRAFRLFVPAQAAAGKVPLVVMLHGCTQTPADFARGTGMDELGAAQGFAVLYPEQPASANSSRCWSWASSEHQRRGEGEPALVVAMVDEAKARLAVDERRIYVAGLSAGAAMAVVLGATYPDVFAALGVHSGLEFQAATNSAVGLWAMSFGGPSPDVQGTLAHAAMGSRARPMPVIVFQGTLDGTVRPLNAAQVIAQWAQTDDLATDGRDDGNVDAVPERQQVRLSGGRRYTRYEYEDRTSGRVWLELDLVEGLGHAWSGGSQQGSYSDPAGPKASERLWEFFQASSPSQ